MSSSAHTPARAPGCCTLSGARSAPIAAMGLANCLGAARAYARSSVGQRRRKRRPDGGNTHCPQLESPMGAVPTRRCFESGARIPKADHGRSINRFALARLRARLDSSEALFGDRIVRRPALQFSPQVRLAGEAAVRVRQGRHPGRAQRIGQGLRVRKRPLRDVRTGRTQGAGRRLAPHHRHRLLRAAGRGGPDLLRQGLFSCARQARCQVLRPAHGRHAAERALRTRHLGLEGQAIRGAGAPGRRRVGAAATALRAGSALDEGTRHRARAGQAGRAATGAPTHRADFGREL